MALHRAWSETTWQMQSLRDNPVLGAAGVRPHSRRGDPGLSPVLTFDPAEDIAAPFIARGARPPIAILREQGVNGEVEMAAAFDSRRLRRARRAHERHHRGPRLAGDFRGFAACGGFSYGDVLGGGEGWAKSILYNARARDEFAAFFARPDTLRARRVQRLPDDGGAEGADPGRRRHWPRFVKNTSEQFEARLS